MSNPFKLTFTLKQHTPIIHFQHEQEGATLRASEVKPKLDRFIIQTLKDSGKLVPDSWYSVKEKGALDYKLNIIGEYKCDFYLHINERNRKTEDDTVVLYETEPYPLLLSNMGGKDQKEDLKNFSLMMFATLSLSSFHTSLLEFIKTHLCDFFLQVNFGNRQSKGFGSFYPDKEKHGNDIWYKDPQSKYWFDLEMPREDNFYVPFDSIDLLYRCLRQGINNKKKLRPDDQRAIERARNEGKYHLGTDGNHYKDVFYFKSLLFLYAKSRYSAGWEKKKVKKEFFPNSVVRLSNGQVRNFKYRLDEQIQVRPKSDTLTYNPENYYLFKDLLGLSTDESWKSYRAEIKKHQAHFTDKGVWDVMPENRKTFQRHTSPILFKPILFIDESGRDVYRVFIFLNQPALDEALRTNKDFIITSSRHDNPNNSSFYIRFPNVFDLKDYFSFVLEDNNFNIDTHVEGKFHNATEFEKLRDIFQQLRNNIS